MRLFLLFVVSLFLTLASCKKNQAAEETFFLKAGQVTVHPTAKQGSGSHKITELWMYVNGKFQGAYPVGHLMPIVSKGKPVTIDIFAGIKNNGISGTRIFWPFYSLIEIDTFAKTNDVVVRNFDFNYNPSTIFAWSEDFEGLAGYTMRKSPVSSVNFRIVSGSDNFEGKSISLELSGDSVTAQIESASSFSLPTGSSNVYLELNYKGNEDFTVGLVGDNDLFKPALNVSSQDNWNKIYVQLSSAVSTSPVSNKYKVAFRLLKTGDLDPKIFLDNIKLVYIQ
jgi:hypothetical protein